MTTGIPGMQNLLKGCFFKINCFYKVMVSSDFSPDVNFMVLISLCWINLYQLICLWDFVNLNLAFRFSFCRTLNEYAYVSEAVKQNLF